MTAHLSVLGCVGVLLASEELSHAQALVARGAINLEGALIYTDSFDSSAPDYPGYWTNSIVKAGGDVVSLGSLINVASANIAGHVRVAAGGTMSIAANGSVGDLAWVGASTPGVEPGWFSDDANVVVKDVVTPQAAWTAAPGSGTAPIYWGLSTNFHTFAHVITASGNYIINDSGDIYVATNCIVNLKVLSSVGTFAPNYLYVAGAGTNSASLKCYVDCTNCILGSDDHAQSWLPRNMVILGTSNCTSLSYKGNGDFAGALYFPQADFLAGGGHPIVDFFGSTVAKTIQVNANYDFHFDEAMWDSTWLPAYPFQNRAAVVGQNFQFGVLLSTLGRISYQWRFEGNDLPGATNSYLWLTNIQLTNAGSYEFVATNMYGCTTSQVQLAVYESATPNLQSAIVPTNGVFQVSVAGVPGFTYALEVSSNLTDWVPIVTNVSPYFFVDTNAVLLPQRFYRAVYLP